MIAADEGIGKSDLCEINVALVLENDLVLEDRILVCGIACVRDLFIDAYDGYFCLNNGVGKGDKIVISRRVVDCESFGCGEFGIGTIYGRFKFIDVDCIFECAVENTDGR